MKFKVFIFWLLLLSLWLMPALVWADSRTIVLDLTISEATPDFTLTKDYLDEILTLAQTADDVSEPQLLFETTLNEVPVTSTVSGSPQTVIIFSVFWL